MRAEHQPSMAGSIQAPPLWPAAGCIAAGARKPSKHSRLTELRVGCSGVGFCIPSDTVRRVVNQVIRFGRVVRPGLGLMLVSDDTAAKVLGPGNRGVIIRSVVPGSGAERARLRCGCSVQGCSHCSMHGMMIVLMYAEVYR